MVSTKNGQQKSRIYRECHHDCCMEYLISYGNHGGSMMFHGRNGEMLNHGGLLNKRDQSSP